MTAKEQYRVRIEATLARLRHGLQTWESGETRHLKGSDGLHLPDVTERDTADRRKTIATYEAILTRMPW